MSTDPHNETYRMFKQLSVVPMNELSFPDLMLLTGHNNCCGVRLKQEKLASAEALNNNRKEK